VVFTSRRRIMGTLRNHAATIVLASIVSALIIGLNIFLLIQIFGGSA
jgi:Mn2+/Fe2+ NRAMP family transporter